MVEIMVKFKILAARGQEEFSRLSDNPLFRNIFPCGDKYHIPDLSLQIECEVKLVLEVDERSHTDCKYPVVKDCRRTESLSGYAKIAICLICEYQRHRPPRLNDRKIWC